MSQGGCGGAPDAAKAGVDAALDDVCACGGGSTNAATSGRHGCGSVGGAVAGDGRHAGVGGAGFHATAAVVHAVRAW